MVGINRSKLAVVAAATVLGLALLGCGGEHEITPGVEELAAQRQAESRDGLHAQVIGEADLPAAGTRSLLDYWIADQGNIPFPFERFLERLAAEDARQQMPATVLLPDGRSLLKAEADFSQPRVIVAADMQPVAGGASLPAAYRGRLFLGYTEAADEIEVVAYNPAAGRFEFQLIKDYCAGCVPRLVYAKRAICTTCHQGAVPIFSVRPWEETNAQAAIAERIREQAGAHYFGLPAKVPLEQPEAIDNLTDQGSVLITTQRVWLDGCGIGPEGRACRRSLLQHALDYIANPAAFDQAPPKLLEVQSRAWPDAGIPLANGDLLSRNPLDAALYEGSLWKQLRNLVFGAPERTMSEDKLAAFDQLPKLPAEFDPLTRRPHKKILRSDSVDGAIGIALMFSAADRERLEAAAAYQPQRLREAVNALPDAIFDPQPLRRVTLMQALLNELGAVVPAARFDDIGELSAPQLDGEPPLKLAEDSPLKAYERYCFACHRGNPSARLDFMSGPDEATVLENIQATDAIREALDWERYQGTRKEGQLMPPADSWQRDQLLRDLADWPDNEPTPLTQMRDMVPSLFDF